MSALEIAAGIALVGSLVVVGIPVFKREVHASHLVEATDGLGRIAIGAMAAADSNAIAPGEGWPFPASAAMTPNTVPRGIRVIDQPDEWSAPTWSELDFRASPPGVPHAFAFTFTSAHTETGAAFVARANGDLDGDGVTSLFEVRGEKLPNQKATVAAGMHIERDLE